MAAGGTSAAPGGADETIYVFTDGGCQGNGKKQNVGAYGIVIRYHGRSREFSKSFWDTTNNRCEMLAAIDGLDMVLGIPGYTDQTVRLVSDSGHLIEGLREKWYVKWRSNGWKTSSRGAVKNKDLWQELARIAETFDAAGATLALEQVKGHAGHPENERCDTLATDAMNRLRKEGRKPPK